MTCVAFSIEFARTNWKIAENSEICENHSLLFIIFHLCPIWTPPPQQGSNGAISSAQVGELAGFGMLGTVPTVALQYEIKLNLNDSPDI